MRHERRPAALGSDASSPAAIPGAGWWEILRRLWWVSSEKGLWVAAAGVAFFAFYALVPALGVVVWTYGSLGGRREVEGAVGELSGALPGEAMRMLLDQLVGTAVAAGEGFGWGLAGCLLLLAWGTLFAARALIAALNHAYRETERRGFLALNGTALLLGSGGLGLAVASAAFLTAGPPTLGLGWALARWPLVAAGVALALALCYRFGPCRAAPKWRWLSWGAAVGAALWVIASLGLSAYAAQVARYVDAFGLAGAVLTLMLWLYLLAYAVLLGAALNAEAERHTSADTTTGPDHPAGSRGARVADR